MRRLADLSMLMRVARAAAGALAILLLLGCSGTSIDQVPPPPPTSPPPPPPPAPPPPPPEQVTATITVDTLQRYQVIRGWEATAQVGQTDFASVPWADAVAAAAVGDLGINALRLEVRSGAENPTDWFAKWRNGDISGSEWRTHRYEVINDNGDPSISNAAGFHFTDLDLAMQYAVLPVRQQLEARGEALYLNLNYVAFSQDQGSAQLDPAEYAELMLVVFKHLQDTYGFTPDAIELILEPDNNTPWTGARIGQAMVATATRLAAAGFHPDFIAPSVMNLGAVPGFFDPMVQIPGALGAVREISYHRYQGVSDGHLTAVAQRGSLYGLRTAMLEHIGSGADDLYKDLTLANVSAWQQYTLAYPSTSDNGGAYYMIQNGTPVLASRSRGLRQYFRYVRAGAHRVRGTSDNADLRSVGFTNVGGAPVVVMHTTKSEVIAIVGLRPGRYEVTTSVAGTPTLGETVVGADGELRFSAPVAGVLTAFWKP